MSYINEDRIDYMSEPILSKEAVMNDPSCYVCGHAPEDHRNGDSECEFEDGCDCICFEAREDEDEEEEPSR